MQKKTSLNGTQSFFIINQQAPSRHCQNVGHCMELMHKLHGCVVTHVLILRPFHLAPSRTRLFGIPWELVLGQTGIYWKTYLLLERQIHSKKTDKCENYCPCHLCFVLCGIPPSSYKYDLLSSRTVIYQSCVTPQSPATIPHLEKLGQFVNVYFWSWKVQLYKKKKMWVNIN